MTDMTTRAGVAIDPRLATFLETQVLGPLGRDVGAFWQGFAALLAEFAPRNRALLAKREDLQAQIDAWHVARAGKPHDPAAYKAFLTEIGYLVPEPGDFQIGTQNVDPEIATMAGPQLVVPILNARFLLNAANARWGSLYDALYGTDALDAPPAQPGGYDKARGDAVIARGRKVSSTRLPPPLPRARAGPTSRRLDRTSALADPSRACWLDRPWPAVSHTTACTSNS